MVDRTGPDEQVRCHPRVRVVRSTGQCPRCGQEIAPGLDSAGVPGASAFASGPNRGQIECAPRALSTVAKMLHHPIYAGIYTFGRTQARSAAVGARTGARSRRSPSSRVGITRTCPAVPGLHHPREQYEANQRKLTANRFLHRVSRAVREGLSLLAGLVRCGRCQRRMQVAYACSGGSRGNSVTPVSTALPPRKDVVTSSSARHWTRRSRMRPRRALGSAVN